MNWVLILEYLVSFVVLYVSVFFTLLYLKNLKKMGPSPQFNPSEFPLVSVLIPAYNEERNIEHCIKSVLALDYPSDKLEIIVLDDGSKDDTYAIAKRFESEKPLVRVIQKKNTGKADTLNFGIQMASGTFVVPLDADSFVSPFSLKRMLVHFTSSSVAAVAAGVRIQKPKNWLEELQRLEYLYAIFSRKVVNCIDAVQVTPGPFSVFRKADLVKIGGFDIKSMVEDQEVALRLQENGYEINSCIDCGVFTEAPGRFRELMKQRTRWQRGGFWNSVKYLHLIGAKQGDFGILVLPYAIFGYFVLVFWFFLSLYSLFRFSPYSFMIGLQWIVINTGPFLMMMLLGVFIYLFWFLYGMRRMFKEEKMHVWTILAFFFVYPMLLTLFWISAAYTEFRTNGKFSW